MKLNADNSKGAFVTMRVTDPETGHTYYIEWESGGKFMRDCASMIDRSIVIMWWLRVSDSESANGTKAELIERAGRFLDDAFEHVKKAGVKPQ